MVESRVVGVLKLHGGHHRKGDVQAPVVVPVDPLGGGELDVADGSVRAGVKDHGADAFGLVEADHALGQRVVIGLSGQRRLVVASDSR